MQTASALPSSSLEAGAVGTTLALMRFRASYMMPNIPGSGSSRPHRGTDPQVTGAAGGRAAPHALTIVPGCRPPETGATSARHVSRSRAPANPFPHSIGRCDSLARSARMLRQARRSRSAMCAMSLRGVHNHATAHRAAPQSAASPRRPAAAPDSPRQPATARLGPLTAHPDPHPRPPSPTSRPPAPTTRRAPPQAPAATLQSLGRLCKVHFAKSRPSRSARRSATPADRSPRPPPRPAAAAAAR